MATKYEIWNKKDLENNYSRNNPLDTFYTPDIAISEAKKASKGTYKTSVFNYNTGKSEEVVLPMCVCVVERDAQSKIRYFAMNGKVLPAKDVCKRCKNSGMDSQNWQLICRACQGTSWKIK
jgi:hypothetical protein